MRNHLRAAVIILIVGGFCAAAAQRKNEPKQQGYDPYTYTGTWFGYVTDSMDVRLGYRATSEQIKKNIAAGARYMLYNPHGGRFELIPGDKVAAFAGQRVFVTASITSTEYGTGPTVEDDSSDAERIKGASSTEPRTVTRLKVISITATDLRDAYDPIVEKGPGRAK